MWKLIQDNRELTILIAIGFAVYPIRICWCRISFANTHDDFNSAQIVILLAIGATFVILTRNIDVSVGSTMGLSAVIVGSLLNAGLGLASAFTLTLLCGLTAGLLNGVLVTLLRIPAIVATLGTLGLYKGMMLLITGGKWIEGLPARPKKPYRP